MSTERQRAQCRAANARWRKRNPDYARRYYLKHKLEIFTREKRRRMANPAYFARYMKRWNTANRKKLIAGRIRCAICLKVVSPKLLRLDHCYTTAKQVCKHRVDKACSFCRRDVLCPSCNLMLGLVKENLRVLQQAQRYIKKWNKILRRKRVRIPKKHNPL
jgi:hypothetical protein